MKSKKENSTYPKALSWLVEIEQALETKKWEDWEAEGWAGAQVIADQLGCTINSARNYAKKQVALGEWEKVEGRAIMKNGNNVPYSGFRPKQK